MELSRMVELADDLNNLFKLLKQAKMIKDLKGHIKKIDRAVFEKLIVRGFELAILRYLSQGCTFQSLAWSWKIGKETVRTIVYETCDVLWQVRRPLYVSEPNLQDFNTMADDFKNLWNLPNCIGVIDGKHVAIQCPAISGSEFFNYKKLYSVVLMAACDARYVFTYVDVEAYGSQSDGGIVQQTIGSQEFGNDDIQLPSFINEPPPKILYSNDTGTQISCTANGNPPPIITWHLRDGSLVTSVSVLRQTSGNGTLYFPAFLSQYYRADIHDNVYRCKASNIGGTILSRDVIIRSVVRKDYDVHVESKDVVIGNVAFLHCTITEHAREYVSVTTWYRGDETILKENSDIGARYIVSSGFGDLFIRNVRSEDTVKQFSCLTENSLTGERKLSEPIYLNAKELTLNTAPQTVQKSSLEFTVERGSDMHLPCDVFGSPLPLFTWYRISDSGNLYPIPKSQRVITAQALLLIHHIDDRDAGLWICKASNQYGDLQLEIHLVVNSILVAHIHPQIQVINSNSVGQFNCSVTGHPVNTIEWFHNGKLLSIEHDVEHHHQEQQQQQQVQQHSHKQHIQEDKFLATGESQKSLSIAYKCSPASVHFIIWETTNAILNALKGAVFIKINEENFLKIAKKFEERWNFLHCIGAIDGKHITMQAPLNSGSTFYNYKKCDDDYNFSMCDIGAAGRQSDGGIFRNSEFGEKFFSNSLPIKFVSPASLMVNKIGRDDRGIYQCIVSNHYSSSQSIAELKLGDTIPELLYPFIEQNVRPGPHISLKCAASGSPPPQFTWLLDSQPIIDVSSLHRYAIGQYVDTSGDVISHLNISHVRTDDGGLYKCIATNSIGSIEHSARLNVYGPPYVRATGPVKAVAGFKLVIQCPFSGYPIESIRWEKSGQEIFSNDRYKIDLIQTGGSLKIIQVDSSHDTGIYTCIVRSRTGEEARRDIPVNVNSPPVIETFNFPKNLPEGGRAQVSCSVSSGDMPVYFTWKKDGVPIPFSLQVTEKKDDFFTLLIFKEITARHSGEYTCFATNSAATVNHTAELLVRVPPQWTYEPKDTAVMLGNQIAIHCEAEGYPEPKITWYRGGGKMAKDYKQLKLRNNSLMVDFATASDEGYYMCQANNNIGTGLKKVVYINVNEPARFEQALKNVSSRRGDSVILSCMAIGDDPINIIWSHNNGRIDLHNYRFNIAEVKSGSGINSQLSINQADRQDSGKYKCVAENPFGRSEHVIFLAVQERPDAPSNLEIIEIGSRTVKLSWRRQFDGNSPVLSYLVQYQPNKSPHSQVVSTNTGDWNSPLTVNLSLPTISGVKNIDGDLREQAVVGGLHPSTTYLIRMLAVNEIEESTFTEPLVIKTQEEAPMDAPHNVQVQTGEMGELIVSWQVPLRETWNGEILGYIVNCTEKKQNINYIKTNTSSKTITVHGWATTKATITLLRKYTKYAVSVRAFNGFGAGPFSIPIIGTTLEGVPEAPPQNVTCSGLSSKSIKISWQEPPLQYHGGIIQGYKILYRPLAKDMEYSSSSQVKRTSNIETYLHTLYQATNYTMRVLAYTSSGDGIACNPVYCATEEDVPDSPANIKASALTGDSILVSWLPPIHKNGLIVHYTVYSRETGRKGQPKTNIVRVDENGKPVMFEARNLNENQMYEFWISASTGIGEGEPTPMVTQSTNTRAPARIASFSQTIRKSLGSVLILECMAIGNPTPRARWFTRNRPVTFSPFYEVTTEGNLKIHSLELNLSGNYTCSAKNLFGEDEIIYTVYPMRAPSAPEVTVKYVNSDSIRLSWESPGDVGGVPIEGYTLAYRIHSPTESWSRIELTSDQSAYTLKELKCGTQYNIKVLAHNKVGEGQQSENIIVYTKGKPPQTPEDKEFIHTNGTCIQLTLASWIDNGCSISHFSIEHRPLGELTWTVVSSHTSRNEENNDQITFCEFQPAMWYDLKVSATNDAGKTIAQFNFATTNVDGEIIPPPEVILYKNRVYNGVEEIEETNSLFSFVVIAVILVVIGILVIFVMRYKGFICRPVSEGYESRVISNEIKQERDNQRKQQVYTASPVKTVDKGNDSEMYEISPYATFSVTGGRTVTGGQQVTSKTPTRGVTASTLDYTVQFKTFGHPDAENLNATEYPVPPNAGFGHIKGKSSWHKQRYYNTDDDSTLSKSMTIIAGSSQIAHKSSKSHRENYYDTRLVSRSKHKINLGSNGSSEVVSGGNSNKISTSGNSINNGNDSESDTSASPINEFSNAPTYRIPVKNSRDMFRPDSSTESNNENSPVHERRTKTPRHITSRLQQQMLSKTKETQSMDILRPGSNNSSYNEVFLENDLRFHPPPNVFSDSKEFSEAECDTDRDRALDLEVQRVMENSIQQIERDELTSLLASFLYK